MNRCVNICRGKTTDECPRVRGEQKHQSNSNQFLTRFTQKSLVTHTEILFLRAYEAGDVLPQRLNDLNSTHVYWRREMTV